MFLPSFCYISCDTISSDRRSSRAFSSIAASVTRLVAPPVTVEKSTSHNRSSGRIWNAQMCADDVSFFCERLKCQKIDDGWRNHEQNLEFPCATRPFPPFLRFLENLSSSRRTLEKLGIDKGKKVKQILFNFVAKQRSKANNRLYLQNEIWKGKKWFPFLQMNFAQIYEIRSTCFCLV